MLVHTLNICTEIFSHQIKHFFFVAKYHIESSWFILRTFIEMSDVIQIEMMYLFGNILCTFFLQMTVVIGNTALQFICFFKFELVL
jgi:hypothetical protein